MLLIPLRLVVHSFGFVLVIMIFLLLGTFVAMTTVDVTKTSFYQLADLCYQVKQGVTFNFLFLTKWKRSSTQPFFRMASV